MSITYLVLRLACPSQLYAKERFLSIILPTKNACMFFPWGIVAGGFAFFDIAPFWIFKSLLFVFVVTFVIGVIIELVAGFDEADEANTGVAERKL